VELSQPHDTLIFIESVMDPFDAPTAVINSGNNGADLDCGLRGRNTATTCRSGQPHDAVSQRGPSRAEREGPRSCCNCCSCAEFIEDRRTAGVHGQSSPDDHHRAGPVPWRVPDMAPARNVTERIAERPYLVVMQLATPNSFSLAYENIRQGGCE
jgi:hypothetical protein